MTDDQVRGFAETMANAWGNRGPTARIWRDFAAHEGLTYEVAMTAFRVCGRTRRTITVAEFYDTYLAVQRDRDQSNPPPFCQLCDAQGWIPGPDVEHIAASGRVRTSTTSTACRCSIGRSREPVQLRIVQSNRRSEMSHRD